MAKRPFYLIAHRCNTPDAAKAAVQKGANAIECDVRPSDGKLWISHDAITGKYDLSQYLAAVRDLAQTSPELALVIFDCKTSDPAHASELLTRVRTELTAGSQLNVLFSVARYEDRGFFDSIHAALTAREGVAIDEHDSASQVSAHFRGLQPAVANHAYGNGIFVLGIDSCIGPAIRQALVAGPIFGTKLVYVWTLAQPASMREYLRWGVDGIFVNEPEDLAA